MPSLNGRARDKDDQAPVTLLVLNLNHFARTLAPRLQRLKG